MKSIFKPAIMASFLLVAAIFGYFSFNAPYMTDNYVFSLDIRPGYAEFYTGSQVAASPMTLAGAFRQACEMYTTWCGRFTGNLAVYLLFMLPPDIWHALSSIAFAVYVLLMEICVFGREWREKLSPGWVLIIAGLLWASVPSFGESFFWLSVGGQIALFGQLAILLPYRFALDPVPLQDATSHSRFYACLLALILFVAGLAVSSLDYATSAALPVTAFATVAYLYYSKKPPERKIPWILLWGALGLSVGGALTLLAPGNSQRLLLTQDHNVLSWLSFTWPERIANWLLHIPLLVPQLLTPLILLAWGLARLWIQRGKGFPVRIPIAALLFLLPFLLTIGAYLFTSWPPRRAFATCSVQLLLCGLIIAVQALRNAGSQTLAQFRFLKWLLAIYCAGTILWEADDFYELHKVAKAREHIIMLSQDGHVTLPPIPASANRYQALGGELGDISEDPDYWINRAMALHYGLKSVRKQSLFEQGKQLEYKALDTSSPDLPRIFFMNNQFHLLSQNGTAFLENGAHIYYYGYPALLASLWKPLAARIYEWLAANAREGSWSANLVPLLLARTDLRADSTSGTSYSAISLVVKLRNPEAIWLVKPGDGKYSFNLVPYMAAPPKTALSDKSLSEQASQP